MKYLVFVCLFLIHTTTYAQIELWGMTPSGGNSNYGVLFSYNPITNVYTKKFDFNDSTSGVAPQGSVMLANDGKLYGMVTYWGSNYSGTLFQYDLNSNVYLVKKAFDQLIDGQDAKGGLMQASNGKIYGMTSFGGVNNGGELFEYNPVTNSYANKFDFNDQQNGSNPIGTLYQASDGKLYGSTPSTANYDGTLFRYDPLSNILSFLYFFDGISSGGTSPTGTFVEAANGMLYALTYYSGDTSPGGILFHFDPVSLTYTQKFDFSISSSNGKSPTGSLAKATDGNLYGMTESGGLNDFGVIFKYDPVNNIFTKIYDFDGSDGSYPKGSLFQASDGNLYGMTSYGGANNYGVIFQYNYSTNSYVKKHDFDSINGRYPVSSLIEVNNVLQGLKENLHTDEFSIYPNPNNGIFVIDLKNDAELTITNLLGEIILEQQIDSGKQSVDIKSYSDGVYLLKIVYPDGKSITRKIIKG
ncbi:MAG: hypothetical protein K0S53_2036 [Bacteroidetes bacterium]|jgi:uncharacterized repeat protein (TIGR03803 family)|nr:hypothetical protein [Bacteroidota bacterium]MDF2453770.1 hypothetical protein [Bacteroidota bacterium]